MSPLHSTKQRTKIPGEFCENKIYSRLRCFPHIVTFSSGRSWKGSVPRQHVHSRRRRRNKWKSGIW